MFQRVEELPGGVAGETDLRRIFRAQADRRVTDEQRWMYNNVAFGLLGAVVEVADGRPFETYVREDVLDPLGTDLLGFRTVRLLSAM